MYVNRDPEGAVRKRGPLLPYISSRKPLDVHVHAHFLPAAGIFCVVRRRSAFTYLSCPYQFISDPRPSKSFFCQHLHTTIIDLMDVYTSRVLSTSSDVLMEPLCFLYAPFDQHKQLQSITAGVPFPRCNKFIHTSSIQLCNV